MDPLSSLGSVSSILGLLGLFQSEERASKGATIDEYLEWLRRKDHSQLASAIQENADLLAALDSLLRIKHEELSKILEDTNRILSDVASRLDGLKPVADALPVESSISKQAVSILEQLNELGASKFLEVKTRDGTTFLLFDCEGELTIPEPRFIDDDLERLVAFGLLLPSYNRKGDRLFAITRAGAAVGG